jgi:hypothetical protein
MNTKHERAAIVHAQTLAGTSAVIVNMFPRTFYTRQAAWHSLCPPGAVRVDWRKAHTPAMWVWWSR